MGFEGTTAYADTPPERLRHLLLAGMRCRYAGGPWGEYLLQWFDIGKGLRFYVNHVFMEVSDSVFPESDEQVFWLHCMLEGHVQVLLNTQAWVDVSPKFSQLFLMPGGRPQEARMEARAYSSVHFEFSPRFLQHRILDYPGLSWILTIAGSMPEIAFLASTAVHDAADTDFWQGLIPGMNRTGLKREYLDTCSRRVLRTHLIKFGRRSKLLERSDLADISKTQREAVETVRMLIETNISEHYSVHLLSSYAGLNEFTLKKVFKRVYEDTIYQYLVTCRMNLARELVISTNRTVWDIARTCGYRNASHFSRQFRRHHGVDPAVMRKRADEFRGR